MQLVSWQPADFGVKVEQIAVPGVLMAAAIPVSSIVIGAPPFGRSMKCMIARTVFVGAKPHPTQLGSGETRVRSRMVLPVPVTKTPAFKLGSGH